MRKRTEITEQTKDNLITAYWDILDSEEASAITVKKIADYAGYHRTTFYEYFTDVSDLKEQAEDLLIEKIKSQSNNILLNNSFDEYIATSVAFYEVNSDYLRILLNTNVSPDFLSRLRDILRPHILQYIPVEKRNIQTDYLIEFALSGLFGIIAYWFQSNKNITAEDLTGLVTPIVKSIIE